MTKYFIKKYGPGFVAQSKTSGRVLAHGRDFKEMWENAEKKKINFQEVVIGHVPEWGVIPNYTIVDVLSK